MAQIKAVPSWLVISSTLSPTATGFVLLIPLRRKLPLILLSITSPSSVLTEYQLPVFLMTSPFNTTVIFKDLYGHDFFLLVFEQGVNLLDILRSEEHTSELQSRQYL